MSKLMNLVRQTNAVKPDKADPHTRVRGRPGISARDKRQREATAALANLLSKKP
jgi:hypothetical protein